MLLDVGRRRTQGFEIHDQGRFDGEDAVVVDVFGFSVEDLGCERSVFVVGDQEVNVGGTVGVAVEGCEEVSGRSC